MAPVDDELLAGFPELIATFSWLLDLDSPRLCVKDIDFAAVTLVLVGSPTGREVFLAASPG